MSKLEKLLKESSLSDEAKKLIQEAWNEEKDELASEIRQEMKERYQEDLGNLTEGLNKMIEDTIVSEMASVYDEKRKLIQDRVKLRESLSKFYEFSNTVLSEEVSKMRAETVLVKESLSKFMNFSNGILAEEIAEFQGERQALVETRVRLLAEGQKQVNKLKKDFVERASRSAAKYIAETTERNLAELKTELLEAKQNMFGRKIFESFASEFMKYQFNENSVLKSLNESVSAKENELMGLKVKLQESAKQAQEAKRKLEIMEDKALRKDIISELSKPLNTQQKQIMESLLASTPTEKLSEDFAKYHKSVLRGTVTESAVQSRPAVNEKAKSTLNEGKVITGDRRAPLEQSGLDSDELQFLDEIAKNAGIR